MKKKLSALAAFSIFGVPLALKATQAFRRGFFRGKTIRFIVGCPPGDGYDTYSRAVPRHFDKHILGKTLVGEVHGANTLLAANHLFANSLVAATIFMLGSSFTPLTPENAAAQSRQPTPPGILMATSDEGVRYLVGGVGSDEREMMENLDADYNVKFVFAETSGDYITDVSVVIDDLHGKRVAQVVTNGPWLYVKLPPGSYRVKATYAATTMEIQRLEVPRGRRLVHMLHWDF